MARLVVLNAGSSSLKFSLYEAPAGQGVRCAISEANLLYEGALSGLGRTPSGTTQSLGHAATLSLKDAKTGTVTREDLGLGVDAHTGLAKTMMLIEVLCDGAALLGIGHRIVHGGARFSTPVRIDAAVLAELTTLATLAPLHQPPALDAVTTLMRLHPDLPQIACFDTAFHHSQSTLMTRFALPRALHEQGIRRYGFHGLSYAYIAGELHHLPRDRRGRVIVLHLGSGASVCALRDGKSVASSMGFTALDGIIMARRPGSLDPGVILHLQQELGMSVAEVTHMLYYDSGLFGLSGESDDMRVLLASSRPEAREAIDMFCESAARMVACLTVPLGGLDCLIFTAGIGENAAPVRATICARLAHLGIVLDGTRNQSAFSPPVQEITTADSTITAYVMKTDEDLEIARAVWALCGA